MPGWFKVPNQIRDGLLQSLGPLELKVLLYVASRSGKTGEAHVSLSRMADDLMAARNNVSKAIRWLVSLGLITKLCGKDAVNFYAVDWSGFTVEGAGSYADVTGYADVTTEVPGSYADVTTEVPASYADVTTLVTPTYPPSKEEPFKKNQEAPIAPKRQPQIHADAESIYALYPRKVGKKAALKSITSTLVEIDRRNLPDPAAWLRERVQAYASSTDVREKLERNEAKFIPHPATWFNQGRYDDEELTAARRPKPYVPDPAIRYLADGTPVRFDEEAEEWKALSEQPTTAQSAATTARF